MSDLGKGLTDAMEEKSYQELRNLVIEERDRAFMRIDTGVSRGASPKQIEEKCKNHLAFLEKAITLMRPQA